MAFTDKIFDNIYARYKGRGIRTYFLRSSANFSKYVGLLLLTFTAAHVTAEKHIATTPEKALEVIGADPGLYSGPMKLESMPVLVWHAERMTPFYFKKYYPNYVGKDLIKSTDEINKERSHALTYSTKCTVLFTKLKYDSFATQKKYIAIVDGQPVETTYITPQEARLRTLLHEFRHCSQDKSIYVRNIDKKYSTIGEADAEYHSIIAMEKANPNTRIREVTLAGNVFVDYRSALAIQYLLDNGGDVKALPPVHDMLAAEDEFKTMRTTIVDRLKRRGLAGLPSSQLNYIATTTLALDRTIPKMARDWAKLYIKAYEFYNPSLIDMVQVARPFDGPRGAFPPVPKL